MTAESARFQARLAGAIALVTTTSGFAAIATGNLVVPDDAAATARNILANETVFRLAVAGDAVSLLYVAYTLLLYNLFRPVSRSLSLLAAFFSLVGTAIGGVNTLFELAPLVVLQGAHSLSGFSAEQLRSIALLFLKLHAQGTNVGLVCFGTYNLLIGYLIYRSTFVPRWLGGLLAISGAGYLVNSFAAFLAPAFEARLLPWILVPGLAELLVAFWLLIFAVDLWRWRALQVRPA